MILSFSGNIRAVGTSVSVVTLCKYNCICKILKREFRAVIEKWCVLYIAFKIIDPTPRNFESY